MAEKFPQMITANRLLDGAVVYLDQAGAWTEAFANGLLLENDQHLSRAINAGEAAVAARHVVGPYAFSVRQTDDGLEPVSVRERIRASRGPTFDVNVGSWAGRVEG